MRFKLDIECGNAAFEDEVHAELGRILAEICANLANGEIRGGCYDLNGNRVGYFELVDSE